MDFEQIVQKYCEYSLNLLKIGDKVSFRPMKRKNNTVNMRYGYVLGRTNLKTGLITIDILTPRKREPKKISSILNVLCHEIAHHQKRPFMQRYKGKWITRQHFPEFYKQVTDNLNTLKEDNILKQFFI